MNDPKIRVLADDVIDKIAAGEVVERPASVVKELIENSIDALADSISVDIESAGSVLIRVADNGSGMGTEDVKRACLRHATSKISDIHDLEKLKTLGFRGEALASIAAVSQMEITTRSEGSEAGTVLELESGVIKRARPCGRERGTTIEVRNLFYNVPARKKFLKSDSTELSEIVSVVGQLILASPGMEIRLTHGGRVLLHATKSMSSIDRVRIVLGADIAENMVDISMKELDRSFGGFVSLPASTRKDRAAQLFFVNGRHVKSRALGDALSEAYASMLERGRHPAAVVFLELPPYEIDVNVHPTKLLVKFHKEKDVRAALAGAVRRKFEEIRTAAAPGAPLRAKTYSPVTTAHSEEEVLHADTSGVQTRFKYDIPVSEPHARTCAFGWPTPTGASVAAGERSGLIFQVGKCYIVRIDDDRIEITDQHAAHERVLYEYFSAAVKGGKGDIQNMLFPVRLDLSAKESVGMSKTLDAFKALGFGVEPFGDRSYVVQSAPAVLKDRDVKTVVMDALADILERDFAKVDLVDEMVKIMSCRAAVKAGDVLAADEMYSILGQLHECELPFTCPHGRPTLLEIGTSELEKMFRRK